MSKWPWLAITASLCMPSVAGAQISGDNVKLGVLNDQSGIYSDLSGQGSVTAARMAVEDFGGKVLGKSIEVIFSDHQNKPDVGSTIATRWYDLENVDAIVDVPVSSVALAVQDVARQRKRIVLFSSAGTSDLTGKACSPFGTQWTFDSVALAKGTASAVTKSGGDSWFFITADYAFGTAMEADAKRYIGENGGKLVGSVRHPQGTTDFSSFLLQAQASKAKVVGLANAGNDTINAIKGASEFGITRSGQKLAAMLIFLSDIHSLGLDVSQGLNLTESFYWDLNDGTRTWSKRFGERMGGRMPTMVHAGVYSAVTHYLKAIQAAGTDDAEKVAAKMQEMKVSDSILPAAEVRKDGRVLRPYYLFEVKSPAESKKPYDYYKLVREIPAEEAARPLSESPCPLVK
ncbi:branched-chain amino acid transport system substrate-binding protein [Xanthobacter flavus]|uniref:ABC transporter permease n=2 Tax=Xanthobacter flavus TaxID=281 RepID=A0A9W6CNJ3_XANFL|nr:ABC transporter substrate-binding protein [Xanthobacter flavus]MDR6334175.1 branched-chain amino acid transport system substrate-binding protein [Xanthobacter flavus]GLI22895.1 ABC transporter permease [Xanthobacter flavus]